MVIGSDLINAKNFSTQGTILMLQLDVGKCSHMSCQTVCITGNIYWLPARCVELTYLVCENQKRGREPELASWHRLYLEQNLSCSSKQNKLTAPQLIV